MTTSNRKQTDELPSELRLRCKRHQRLAYVLKYLEQNKSLTYDIESTLVARYLPIAMSAEGKFNPVVAQSSIAQLKSYILAIEQLTEWHRSGQL